MEKSNISRRFQAFTMAVVATLIGALVWAQDKTAKLDVDVNMNKATDVSSGNWMQNPLVWVIGALVLIILIALVSRGGGNK